MTTDREIKRRTRERARVTGESYATARARLVNPAGGADAVDDLGRSVFVWLASRGKHQVLDGPRAVDRPADAGRLAGWIAMGLVALAASGQDR